VPLTDILGMDIGFGYSQKNANLVFFYFIFKENANLVVNQLITKLKKNVGILFSPTFFFLNDPPFI